MNKDNPAVNKENTETGISYEQAQVNKVVGTKCGYRAAIKLADDNGNTNWLSIEDDKLEKIKAIIIEG